MVNAVLFFVAVLLALMLVPVVFMAVVVTLGFEDDVHEWVLRKLIKPRCKTCRFHSEYGCSHPCENLCKLGCLWMKKEE